jgi:PhnB protein
MASAIPDGYHSVTSYLVIDGAAKAIDFYKRAFGATEIARMVDANGRIGHAEIKIGDSHVMLCDEYPEMGFRGPTSLGGVPSSLMLYVENADRTFSDAMNAGAQQLMPMQNQFYGDRSGTLKDPFGHVWTIGTHVEDVAPDEMERRAKEFFEKKS